jgi:hypothetical protein
MEEMEQNMRLQGCTSIEDKLQDGVPWAIDFLKRACMTVSFLFLECCVGCFFCSVCFADLVPNLLNFYSD